MYIYLSDRKRRFYLSQASPQNLSPKRNLSLKDRRFLQKNVINIQDSLSIRLVKQQKVLYSKFIGSLIEPQSTQRKKDKAYAEQGRNQAFAASFAKEAKLLQNNSFALQRAAPCKAKKVGEITPPLYLQVWEKNLNLYKTRALTLTSKASSPFSAKALHSKHSKGLCSASIENNCKIETARVYAFSALSVYVQNIKTYTEKAFADIQNKSSSYLKNRINIPESASFATFADSATCFAKEAKQAKPLTKDLQNKQNKAVELLSNSQNYRAKQRPAFAKQSEKKDILKACLQMPFLAFSICKTMASPPLYANGRSLYLYSRYLYNMESLKTSIMPQVLQNQKTASRYKYILHERKKIALLYGQLAKRDMQTLIKSASALPGLFEDNMFTLLESRVDVLVHRAGFSNSIAGARQLIRNGLFYINGRKISSCKTRAFPGDFFDLFLTCSAKGTSHLQNEQSKAPPSSFALQSKTSSATFTGFLAQQKQGKPLQSKKTLENGSLLLFLQSKEIAKQKKQNQQAEAVLFNCYKQTTEQLYNIHVGIGPLANPLQSKLPHYKESRFSEKKAKLSFAEQQVTAKKRTALHQSLGLYKILCKKDTFLTGPLLASSLASFAGFAKQVQQAAKQATPGLCSLQSKTDNVDPAIAMHKLQSKEQDKKKAKQTAKKDKQDKTTDLSKISSFTKGTARSRFFKQMQSSCFAKQFNTEEKGLWSNKLLNSCSAHILQYKVKQRRFFWTAIEKEVAFHRFMKNIQNANSASIWGQKPLHLEISHKRGCFIYMYRPQKIIFPVSLDLHAIKGSF